MAREMDSGWLRLCGCPGIVWAKKLSTLKSLSLGTPEFAFLSGDLCTSFSQTLFRDRENPVALPGEINRSETVIS